jgi:hypothetical protein
MTRLARARAVKLHMGLAHSPMKMPALRRSCAGCFAHPRPDRAEIRLEDVVAMAFNGTVIPVMFLRRSATGLLSAAQRRIPVGTSTAAAGSGSVIASAVLGGLHNDYRSAA